MNAKTATKNTLSDRAIHVVRCRHQLPLLLHTSGKSYEPTYSYSIFPVPRDYPRVGCKPIVFTAIPSSGEIPFIWMWRGARSISYFARASGGECVVGQGFRAECNNERLPYTSTKWPRKARFESEAVVGFLRWKKKLFYNLIFYVSDIEVLRFSGFFYGDENRSSWFQFPNNRWYYVVYH